MKKWLLSPLLAASMVYGAETKIGVVNFGTCMAESKIGKQETEAFEAQKKQMESLMQELEKQINEVTAKLGDPDYMDGLSPDGEQELKARYQSGMEEYQRNQSKFYKMMQDTQMQMVQKMQAYVATASDVVAKKHGLDLIVTRDACYSFSAGNDVTSSIVDEMDKAYDAQQKEKK